MTDGHDAGAVLITQRQVEQHVLKVFQADLGQLLGHGFTDTLECRDRHFRQLSHGRALLGSGRLGHGTQADRRSEEHTSELQSLLRISYAVFCLTKNNTTTYEVTRSIIGESKLQNRKRLHT